MLVNLAQLLCWSLHCLHWGFNAAVLKQLAERASSAANKNVYYPS